MKSERCLSESSTDTSVQAKPGQDPDGRSTVSSDRTAVSITPSQVLEYLFCPRFIYYMECLKIAQHEELRFKVQMGREVHEKKTRMNPEYLRRKIGAVKKETSVYLSSADLRVRGIVDEVLTLENGCMAPLEYKYAEFRQYLFKTHKTQLALQALLIRENYGKEVKKGFIVYTRSKNLLREVLFHPEDFRFAVGVVGEILEVIQTGYYPKGAKSRAKCVDCCYRNICV